MSDSGEARNGLGWEMYAWGRDLVAESVAIPRDALRFLGSAHQRPRRSPPPGSPPGELVIPQGAHPTQVHLLAYGADGVEEREVATLEELPGLLRSDRVTWLDVAGFADREMLERLRERFDVHPLAMADVVHVPQRPKAELYGDRLLAVTQMVQLADSGAIEIEQLSLVLGPGFVLTFQERPGDVFDPVRARIRSPSARIRQMGPDFLAYALLDAVIDGYFPVIETLGGVLEALEEEVIESPTRASLVRIHATRRSLLYLHRVLWRQRDALSGMLRDDELPISEPVRVYLRDAYDHAFQVLDTIETYREMTVGLMDVYLSSASNRMNEVMKTLTIMASIFIPLTFLVGVYGMNFEHMPELHWRWGYAALWGAMTAIALALVGWFRHRGWLERGSS